MYFNLRWASASIRIISTMYTVQCTKTQRHTHTLCVYARIERNIEWLDGEKKNGIQHRIGIESSKKEATKIYRTAKNVNVDWWLTCATPFGVSTFINFNIIFCYTSFYYVIRFAYIFCFFRYSMRYFSWWMRYFPAWPVCRCTPNNRKKRKNTVHQLYNFTINFYASSRYFASECQQSVFWLHVNMQT